LHRKRRGQGRLGRAETDLLAGVLKKGTAVRSEGTRVLKKGTAVRSEGTRVLKKGTAVRSEGTRVLKKGTAVHSEGTRVLKKGTAVRSEGTRVLKKGTAVIVSPGRDGVPPPPDLYQNLNAFGLIVAAVYDRRWLTPALIETPLQVKTAR
jgi:putative membrane protein